MTYQIVREFRRPDRSVIDRFRSLAFALIAEQLDRSQILDPAIAPLAGRDWFICGPALTVKLESIDILMVMAATEIAQPGDVIVVAAGGHREAAVWGGSLTRAAKDAGSEGAVIDGVIQDTRSILAREFPIFCRGAHPAHGSIERPGSINVPVSCGGVVINPGDLVIGNLDGVIVVPFAVIPAVLAVAERETATLRQRLAERERSGLSFFQQMDGPARLRAAGIAWSAATSEPRE